jgi:hypothetical protein
MLSVPKKMLRAERLLVQRGRARGTPDIDALRAMQA